MNDEMGRPGRRAADLDGLTRTLLQRIADGDPNPRLLAEVALGRRGVGAVLVAGGDREAASHAESIERREEA